MVLLYYYGGFLFYHYNIFQIWFHSDK
jgi:hypothetical protein